MASRYERTEEQNLNDLDYKSVYTEKFDKNRRSYIPIIQTININYPTFEEMLELDYVDRVWTMGDRYHKLAEIYYGDPTYWWVIAWFNKKPTESHIKPGDVIRVPTSLGSILSVMGY
tara:strand:- start:2735 stop:3085 length:351 start_codon:yes stop_codon:yes gene_type:complete